MHCFLAHSREKYFEVAKLPVSHSRDYRTITPSVPPFPFSKKESVCDFPMTKLLMVTVVTVYKLKATKGKGGKKERMKKEIQILERRKNV